MLFLIRQSVLILFYQNNSKEGSADLQCPLVSLSEMFLPNPAYALFSSAFSTLVMALFTMGIRQFLFPPNSTITMSSVISMITP